MAFTVPPANKVEGQGGIVPDLDNTYAALAAVAGINVLDSRWAGGADPTGVADSTAAFTAALAAAPANGGIVRVPAGTYLITSTLAPPVTGTVIAGEGWGSQLLFDGSSVSPLIAAPATSQVRCHVRDLRITQTHATAAGTAIEASYFVDSKIERVLIDGSTAAPLIGISFNTATTFYNLVSDCRVNCAGTSSIAIRLDNGANSNVVRNCRVLPSASDATSIGVYVNSASIDIDHVDIEGGAGTGISVGASGHACTILAPYLEACNVNLALASGVVAPVVVGGTIESGVTADIQDNGAVQPVYIGMRSTAGGNHSYGALSLRAIASGPDIIDLYDSSGTLVWQVTNAGSMIGRKAAAFTGPVIIGSSSQDAGGSGSGLTLCHTTDPGSNPASGHGIVYIDSTGHLCYRGASGTVTQVAPA